MKFGIEFNKDKSVYWREMQEYNLMVIRATEEWANDKLHAKGYLLLNDVLEELGFNVGDQILQGTLDPRWGWVKDKFGKVTFGQLRPGVDIPLEFEVTDIFGACRN